MQTRVEKHCGTHPAQEIHLVGGKKQQRDTFEGARTHTQTDTAALTTCCVHPHRSNEPALSPRVMVVTLTRKERANAGGAGVGGHAERAARRLGKQTRAKQLGVEPRARVCAKIKETKSREVVGVCASVSACRRRAGAQSVSVHWHRERAPRHVLLATQQPIFPPGG